VAAPQVLITPNLADQVPRQQFSFDFDLERALVSADQRAGDGAEAPDASSAAQARLLSLFVAHLFLADPWLCRRGSGGAGKRHTGGGRAPSSATLGAHLHGVGLGVLQQQESVG